VAKAQFSKHQKVWVESVGAWAVVERIIPVWAKDFEEPVRIGYDVGLGREFAAAELAAEPPGALATPADGGGAWRILRARNKWQSPEDCAHHPEPGTFPVVVTDAQDWGGWRTPGAEYDRDPHRIEAQARLIAAAPRLARIARDLAAFADEHAAEAPAEVLRLGRAAAALLSEVGDPPAGEKTRAD
jgi:hypothetical protein